MTCATPYTFYSICGLLLAAALMHDVTYDMLLRPSLLSNYFRLELLLVRHGEVHPALPECCKLVVALTVEGQKDAVRESGRSLLSVLLEMPEAHKYVKLKIYFLATCYLRSLFYFCLERLPVTNIFQKDFVKQYSVTFHCELD